jgi:hypothetical protein
MIDPLFWLGLSFLIVSICLAIALAAAIPALQELGRAARSAEKLFDTLTRELPPTLEAIRLTGLEISDLTDDMTSGVQSAGQVVQKVDSGLDRARRQARRVGSTARRAAVGLQAAWQALTHPNRDRRRADLRADSRSDSAPRGRDRLPSSDRPPGDRYGLPSGQAWAEDDHPDRYESDPAYANPDGTTDYAAADADYGDDNADYADAAYGNPVYAPDYAAPSLTVDGAAGRDHDGADTSTEHGSGANSGASSEIAAQPRPLEPNPDGRSIG